MLKDSYFESTRLKVNGADFDSRYGCHYQAQGACSTSHSPVCTTYFQLFDEYRRVYAAQVVWMEYQVDNEP